VTPQTRVLEQYEAMARASAAMLDAARDHRWDDLVSAEHDCAASVAALRALGETVLDEAGRRRKYAIIRSVLAQDAEIRTHTQPWLAKLEAFLTGTAASRRLAEAYR
jgi:flagellar protein FliT